MTGAARLAALAVWLVAGGALADGDPATGSAFDSAAQQQPGDREPNATWRPARAALEAAGEKGGRKWLETAIDLARTEAARGEKTGALERVMEMVDVARSTPLHGVAAFAAADFAFGAGDFVATAMLFAEGLAVAPDLVREAYGAVFVAFAQAQERAEEAGEVAAASALIEARIAILNTFMADAAAEPVQTLLFQKFFLLHQASSFGPAADALREWAGAAPVDADERAFIEQMAPLFLEVVELSSYSAARDVQLGMAELAVAFAELLEDPFDPRRAEALRVRAAAQSGLGHHAAARETLLRGATLLERSNAPGALHLVYEDLAINAWRRGEAALADDLYAEASRLYRRAIDAGGPSLAPIDAAILKTNRALVAIDRGKAAAALELLAAAHVHFEDARQHKPLKWNDKREAARIEATAGLALTTLGRTQDALAAIERAIAIARDALPHDHPDLALVLANAADLLFVLERPAQALEFLREAVSINASALPDTLPQRVEIERKLALAHLVDGRTDNAAGVLKRVTEARKAPAYRETLGEAVADFELYAHTALARGDPGAAIEALQWTEVTSSAEALAQMKARLALEDKGQALLLRRRQDLVEAHRRAESELLAAFARGESAQRRGEIASELEGIQADLERVETSLKVAGLDVSGLATVEPLALAEIQRLLRPDEALLMFLLPGLDPERIDGVNGSTNRVIAVTRDRVSLGVVPEVSRRQLRRRIARFRCAMAVSDPGCGPARDETRGAIVGMEAQEPLGFDTAAAHGLWRDLFGGIQSVIGGKDHLILVPPADLLDLPFAALVTSADTPQTLAGVDWLIRRHALSVLPSVGALKTLRQQRRDTRLTPFLGVGDPAIGTGGEIDCTALASLQVRAASPTAAVIEPQENGLALADVDAIAALPRLPDAACEVKAIAQTLGEPSRILLGEAASERAIKTMNAAGELRRYEILVFATHGLVAGEAGAAAPGLVLSPPAEASLFDDGLLTSAEIATLRLDAGLVVLSACNTAAGERGDADGFSGLTRAFFHAGARALLVTHWAVFSDAAVTVSTDTLARLKEDPSLHDAEALREAMLSILDTPAQPERRLHPSYWAAFTVVGAS